MRRASATRTASMAALRSSAGLVLKVRKSLEYWLCTAATGVQVWCVESWICVAPSSHRPFEDDVGAVHSQPPLSQDDLSFTRTTHVTSASLRWPAVAWRAKTSPTSRSSAAA
jgi:hypothetical protein